MSAQPLFDEPVVVRVGRRHPVLVGHDGLEYQSPPSARAEALALVRLLLGRGGDPHDGEVSWRCPIAGGHARNDHAFEPLPEFDAPRARPPYGVAASR